MSQGAPAPERAAGAERRRRLARLLVRAREGEAGALDAIVRELNPLLWHVARAQGVDRYDAADVVQSTWLELVRRLDDIVTPEALTAWLVTAAKREAWRVNARRRRLAAEVGVDFEVTPDPDPADHALASERAEALRRNFGRLSAKCQELLRIVAVVDRPDYTIVSDALGMPVGSIGPTRGRCLEKLRRLLLRDPQWSAA